MNARPAAGAAARPFQPLKPACLSAVGALQALADLLAVTQRGYFVFPRWVCCPFLTLHAGACCHLQLPCSQFAVPCWTLHTRRLDKDTLPTHWDAC